MLQLLYVIVIACCIYQIILLLRVIVIIYYCYCLLQLLSVFLIDCYFYQIVISRVPGVLIVSNRRDRLMVYLSRDRPNVEGVVRFMVAHNVHQSLYDCQIMPYRIQNRPTITPGDLLVHSR